MIRLYSFKNTLSFPSEETSLDSGLPSHLPIGDVPCPPRALHTVFSTTQSDLLIQISVSLAITVMEMPSVAVLLTLESESHKIDESGSTSYRCIIRFW